MAFADEAGAARPVTIAPGEAHRFEIGGETLQLVERGGADVLSIVKLGRGIWRQVLEEEPESPAAPKPRKRGAKA